MDGIERHAFTFQDIQHQIVRGPEVGFGIALRAQSVLVAHHHQFIIGVLAQETECRDYTGQKLELLVTVYLFVGGFHQDGAVAVYE